MKRFVVAALTTVALAGGAHAQQFFRIGTGGTAGTYYPVGGMIANAVSQPGKIIVTAQASNGSVANVTAIAGGGLESGFTQADVATWAQTGTGVYEGKTKVPELRLIANLSPESVHLVARKGAGIKTVFDLRGKRVALDEPGSGTLVDARLILAAYGL
ncbi:MAG TPA: TAXI family TRAP transporter solute-binding subunit, partial [Caldimonas sp.]